LRSALDRAGVSGATNSDTGVVFVVNDHSVERRNVRLGSHGAAGQVVLSGSVRYSHRGRRSGAARGRHEGSNREL
jgi:hypothetical protein